MAFGWLSALLERYEQMWADRIDRMTDLITQTEETDQ